MQSLSSAVYDETVAELRLKLQNKNTRDVDALRYVRRYLKEYPAYGDRGCSPIFKKKQEQPRVGA